MCRSFFWVVDVSGNSVTSDEVWLWGWLSDEFCCSKSADSFEGVFCSLPSFCASYIICFTQRIKHDVKFTETMCVKLFQFVFHYLSPAFWQQHCENDEPLRKRHCLSEIEAKSLAVALKAADTNWWEKHIAYLIPTFVTMTNIFLTVFYVASISLLWMQFH